MSCSSHMDTILLGFTLVLVKILPKVRQNLQKKRENSWTQIDEVTLIRPTISMSRGRLDTEGKRTLYCVHGENS